MRSRAEGAEFFRLEVEDYGIGIRAEDLDRLFVEFQQLDASTAKRYQGTGLGLALTKRLAEAQGGRVEVRSAVGEGSVFSAVLPARRANGDGADGREDSATGTLPSPRCGGRPGGRDDPEDRQWLTATLSRAGYRVEVAATGAEAIAMCRARRYDALTLDILLPDMQGWQVLEAVRAGELNAEIKVVIVSVLGRPWRAGRLRGDRRALQARECRAAARGAAAGRRGQGRRPSW
jgi:CheY-like chemotaxis protein